MENELILKGRTEIQEKPRVEEPKMYKVIIHNDHYTTMDFVVEVIVKVFHKVPSEATRIMLEVHNKGKGIVGIYPYDIAYTKIRQVHEMARARNFPLRCSAEEA
jgi:ATP-dependent Clp protease adaptor protein ClpS